MSARTVGPVMLLVAVAACGKGGDAPAAAGSSGRSGAVSDPQGPPPAIAALDASPDPCKWVPFEEVQGILGPLKPGPQRVFHADQPEPRDDGNACLYVLADTAPKGAGARIAVGIDPTGNLGVENVGRILNARLKKDAPGLGEVDTATAGNGWDASAWNIDVFHGRVGSLAVEVGTPDWATAKVDRTKVEQLAALVRDRMPDKPFTAKDGGMAPDGDPCSLLSQADVEKAAGRPLALPPFRSASDAPLYAESGPACTYWFGRHRALTVAPEWSDGPQLFKAATMMGNIVEGKLGVSLGQSADTLEGGWDQVALSAGSLVFLKGDRMVALSQATSGLPLTATLQLANKALGTLASQK